MFAVVSLRVQWFCAPTMRTFLTARPFSQDSFLPHFSFSSLNKFKTFSKQGVGCRYIVDGPLHFFVWMNSGIGTSILTSVPFIGSPQIKQVHENVYSHFSISVKNFTFLIDLGAALRTVPTFTIFNEITFSRTLWTFQSLFRFTFRTLTRISKTD